MQTFYKICLILMIVGGINWGLVGLFQFDLWAGCWAVAAPSGPGSCSLWWARPRSAASRVCFPTKQSNAKTLLAREPFFLVPFILLPADKIGQGKGLIRAVGIGGTMGRHRRPLDLPHDVVDGPAVFGQVGLVAAGVGEQNLAQVAHHQCQG